MLKLAGHCACAESRASLSPLLVHYSVGLLRIASLILIVLIWSVTEFHRLPRNRVWISTSPSHASYSSPLCSQSSPMLKYLPSTSMPSITPQNSSLSQAPQFGQNLSFVQCPWQCREVGISNPFHCTGLFPVRVAWKYFITLSQYCWTGKRNWALRIKSLALNLQFREVLAWGNLRQRSCIAPLDYSYPKYLQFSSEVIF